MTQQIGHLGFMYEVLDDELTTILLLFLVTVQGGITDTVSSISKFIKCVISMVDNETLLMDDVQVVRVK